MSVPKKRVSVSPAMDLGIVWCLLAATPWLSCGSISASQLHAGTRPAPEYRGIKIGTSLVQDAKRILGEPSRIDRYSDNVTELIYVKPSSGIEQISVGVRNSVIIDLTVTPVNMTPSEAIQLFGSRYRTVRYDFDECLSDGESAPLYENPNGGVEYIEYRQRGIFLQIVRAPLRVQFVIYQRNPPGTPRSQCGAPNSQKSAGKP